MLSKELIKKIKTIEIKSNKIAEQIFSGEYHSYFKGNGMEFDEIREYVPGDDIRNIDWNVTARQSNAFIKKYKEEREQNLFLLIDMSNSNSFGIKKEKIAEIGATLAFSAMKNNDKIGAILFTDKIEKIIPSQKGKKHILSIVENILDYVPENKGTNLSEVLSYFNKIEKKKSIVFLISDFLDSNYEKELKVTSRKHDLISIRILEKNWQKIPKGAFFSFEDLETGQEIILDTTKKELNLNLNSKILTNQLLNIYTDEDYVKALRLFFKKRRR